MTLVFSRLGWVTFSLLIGLLVGGSVSYVTRDEGSTVIDTGSTPEESPTKTPTSSISLAPDITYDALATGLEYDMREISNGVQTWSFPVPKGWIAYPVPGDVPIKPKKIADFDELRFRPKDEPTVGGFSLRVKAVPTDQPFSTKTMVSNRLELLRHPSDPKDIRDLTVLERTDSALYFTFVERADHLRYNFFQYFEVPGEGTTLEMSVAGRAADEGGLRALFDDFAELVEPVER